MSAIQELTTQKSWTSPCELVNHIVATHHDCLRMTLPELEQLSDQIGEEGLVPPTLMDGLQRDFTPLLDLLERHISEQEGWLFPMIRHVHDAVEETEWGCELVDSLEWLMDRLSHENQEAVTLAGRVWRRLRDISWTGKGPAVGRLREEVQALRDDLTNHTHLETDVLFPQVREQLQADGLRRSVLFW